MNLIRKYSLPLSIAVCAAVLALFSSLTGSLGADRLNEQERSLNDSLERCIMACYALEGFFPPDLEYMEEHYGLSWDESLFFVDYRPVAANIRPDYFVLRTAGEGQANER